MGMKELLLGTNNRGKVEEMEDILKSLDIHLLTPAMLDLNLEVPEDGDSYEENAAIKATAFSNASRLPCLADDSGLEVDILGGLPGLHSRRFAPQAGASDADRRAYLLEQLHGKPRPWTANFHATIVIVYPDGRKRIARGECAGEIIPEERGINGFGYDPIFLIPSL